MKLSTWISDKLFFLTGLITGVVRMRVIALVGPSGTGKSFRAGLVADQFHIRYILDDGILIKDQRIIAGKSAKRETVYLSAVKTALFADEAHRREVRYVIERTRPRQILVLATSDKMILKICEHLHLPKPARTVYIHEIASEEEIALAQESRINHGRHVIPVPSREVRQNAPTIVDDSIKVWSQGNVFSADKYYEKTIVRPHFSPKDPVQVPTQDLRRAFRQTILAHIPDVRITSTSIQYNEGYELLARIVPPSEASFAVDQMQNIIRAYLQKQTGVFIRKLILMPLAHKSAINKKTV
jgi:hypothetical protein